MQPWSFSRPPPALPTTTRAGRRVDTRVGQRLVHHLEGHLVGVEIPPAHVGHAGAEDVDVVGAHRGLQMGTGLGGRCGEWPDGRGTERFERAGPKCSRVSSAATMTTTWLGAGFVIRGDGGGAVLGGTGDQVPLEGLRRERRRGRTATRCRSCGPAPRCPRCRPPRPTAVSMASGSRPAAQAGREPASSGGRRRRPGGTAAPSRRRPVRPGRGRRRSAPASQIGGAGTGGSMRYRSLGSSRCWTRPAGTRRCRRRASGPGGRSRLRPPRTRRDGCRRRAPRKNRPPLRSWRVSRPAGHRPPGSASAAAAHRCRLRPSRVSGGHDPERDERLEERAGARTGDRRPTGPSHRPRSASRANSCKRLVVPVVGPLLPPRYDRRDLGFRPKEWSEGSTRQVQVVPAVVPIARFILRRFHLVPLPWSRRGAPRQSAVARPR